MIACFNGVAHLGSQLEALAEERPSFEWELVVADNGSTDASRELCDSYRQRLPLTVIDASETRGQAHARNVGAGHSRADKILFLDQDDVIASGYLTCMEAALEHHPFIAASMEYELLNPLWARRARRTALFDGVRAGPRPWTYGCVLGVRREVFARVRGFDEALPSAEDIDLCWRIARDADAELTVAEGAVLHYRLKSSLPEIFHQGRLYGRGGPALYRRWRQDGMARRSWLQVVRSWAGVLRRLGSREPGARAEALYLLGHRIGCIEGSFVERVVFL